MQMTSSFSKCFFQFNWFLMCRIGFYIIIINLNRAVFYICPKLISLFTNKKYVGQKQQNWNMGVSHLPFSSLPYLFVFLFLICWGFFNESEKSNKKFFFQWFKEMTLLLNTPMWSLGFDKIAQEHFSSKNNRGLSADPIQNVAVWNRLNNECDIMATVIASS